jgi:hypothetical protein
MVVVRFQLPSQELDQRVDFGRPYLVPLLK